MHTTLRLQDKQIENRFPGSFGIIAVRGGVPVILCEIRAFGIASTYIASRNFAVRPLSARAAIRYNIEIDTLAINKININKLRIITNI